MSKTSNGNTTILDAQTQDRMGGKTRTWIKTKKEPRELRGRFNNGRDDRRGDAGADYGIIAKKKIQGIIIICEPERIGTNGEQDTCVVKTTKSDEMT